MTKVYYEDFVVFSNLSSEQIEHLEKENIIKKSNNRYILIKNYDFKHLFNENIPFFKRKQYFKRLDEKRLFCEDCGKPYSFHIRPALEPDGKINFKKIVCVCKDCRTKFLEKRDIVVPQFKKDMSYKTLNKEIKEEIIKNYKDYPLLKNTLLKDERYFYLQRKRKRIYGLTKIVLPPLPSEDYIHEKIRVEMEKVLVNNLGETVDLSIPDVRIAIKRYLLGECYGICPCCGKQMTIEDITIDHIVAKSKNGENSIYNFIGLCEDCNKEKDAFSILSVLSRKKFKFLPVRVLLKAYEEQEKLKKELVEVDKEIEAYIKNLKKDLNI